MYSIEEEAMYATQELTQLGYHVTFAKVKSHIFF
jgi:hypothetical protein